MINPLSTVLLHDRSYRANQKKNKKFVLDKSKPLKNQQDINNSSNFVLFTSDSSSDNFGAESHDILKCLEEYRSDILIGKLNIKKLKLIYKHLLILKHRVAKKNQVLNSVVTLAKVELAKNGLYLD